MDPYEFQCRAEDYANDKNRHYYFMALKSDAIIDATVKGNNSRFINHSCDPNAETQKASFYYFMFPWILILFVNAVDSEWRVANWFLLHQGHHSW